MRLPGHADALADAAAAADWYDDKEDGLGDRFLVALDETLELLTEFPQLGHRVVVPGDSREFRRLAVNRFPYSVVYLLRDGPFVIAVPHDRQRPGFWAKRT